MNIPKSYKSVVRRLYIPAILLLMVSSVAAQSSDTRFLPAINSRAEFDTLSRSYDADTPFPLPHVLFVIDRKDNNKIYYVNAKRYTFHKDFVNGNYLSLERGQEFF